MDEQSKSIGRLVAVVAAVVLMAIAGARYFGEAQQTDGMGGGGDEDDGSPYVIRSIPSGAEVFINNVHVGLTPHPYKEFDPGVLRIRLEHAYLAPVETLLIVPEGAPVPVFHPFVFTVPVELASVPAGAEPVINGRTLRPYEVASFALPANDTVEVAFRYDGEQSQTVRFSPMAGILESSDTARWHWQPGDGSVPAQLTKVFAQQLRITSEPPGADIYLDDNPLPIGRTNSRVAVPYGQHRLILRLLPFDDFILTVSSGDEKGPPLSAILQRSVWLAAVDEQNPFSDLNAQVEWVRQGEEYLISPDDDFVTPGNVLLGGRPCEVRVTCAGYADTTIVVPPFAAEAIIGMRALPKPRMRIAEPEEENLGWVRFVVKAGRRDFVAGAEVFGIEKNNGRTVRYGPTGEDGVVTTRVPVGDYEWWAAKEGFVAGKPNGERIKPGRKTKEITLKVKPM